MMPCPLRPTLFPYTTLFRSQTLAGARDAPAPDAMPLPAAPKPTAHSEVLARQAWADVTPPTPLPRSEEHTSELQSLRHLVCRLLLEKKKNNHNTVIA